jgi:Zn-dependent metalloprotease
LRRKAIRPGTGAIACLALLAAAATMAAVLCGGCGQSTDPRAKKLLEEANGHLSKAAEEVKNLASFNEQWSSLFKGQVSKETATKVRQLLENAQATEQKALDETTMAADLIEQAEKLPMSPDVREYVKLRRQGVEEQLLFLSTELEAMDLRIKAIKGQENGQSLEDLLRVDKQINEVEARAREHARKAGEFYKQADDYYKERGLGK